MKLPIISAFIFEAKIICKCIFKQIYKADFKILKLITNHYGLMKFQIY